jgi:acetolactate synthase I/III small subunit
MQHTLTVLVEDKAGVLARVSAMFSNRGFNIHSLAVGPTHQEGRSRITLVVDAPELEQLKKQLNKLVNVIKVQEMESAEALEREVMIVRISAPPSSRGEVRDTASLFDARIIDISSSAMTFEVAGTPQHLQAFLEHLSPYGVIDLVKSGRIAMRRESELTPSSMVAGAGK